MSALQKWPEPIVNISGTATLLYVANDTELAAVISNRHVLPQDD